MPLSKRIGLCLSCLERFEYEAEAEPGTTKHYCEWPECLAERAELAERVKEVRVVLLPTDSAGFAGYNHGLNKYVANRGEWEAEVKKQGVKPVG